MEIRIQEVNDKLLDQYIEEIKNGNQNALADLYHMTQQKVYGLILSILKNKHDAEDVLHDCYVSIYSSAQSYCSSGRPLSWILGIARNLSLLRLRQQRRVVNISYDDFEESYDYNQDISIEEKLVIREFMKILSEEEREIVYLHTIAGFKFREIAHICELALPTVLSKYHRALKKLRKELEKGEK